MEKIILVHYINVGNIYTNDVSKIMEDVMEKFSPKEEDNIISYWIPVREGETRVECINPKLVSEEDFTEAKQVLERNQEIVNNIIKWVNGHCFKQAFPRVLYFLYLMKLYFKLNLLFLISIFFNKIN